MEVTYLSQSPEETKAIARKILADIPLGSVIALTGDLGSGKTTFTQGFASALGIRESVLSPTFKLVSHYQGEKAALFHIDCYRLKSAEDFLNIGGETYLLPQDGYTLIEWADVIGDLLPATTLNIHFDYDEKDIETKRRITVAMW